MIEIAHLSNDIQLLVQSWRFLPRLALVDWNIKGNPTLMRFLAPRLFDLRHCSCRQCSHFQPIVEAPHCFYI